MGCRNPAVWRDFPIAIYNLRLTTYNLKLTTYNLQLATCYTSTLISQEDMSM